MRRRAAGLVRRAVGLVRRAAALGRTIRHRIEDLLIYRLADQVAVAGLALLALVGLAGWYLLAGGGRGGLVELDHAPPLSAPYQIDFAEADWQEWVILPGIGESLAERIVAHQQQYGPFTAPEQLLQVRGIGPKTLARIRPYIATGPAATQRPVAGT